MNGNFLELMWQQAEDWRLISAAVCGVIVGIIYFYSLRWSVNHLSELKHKLKIFALTALCRMALFFGVLFLIGHRNVAVISLYVIAFFITKVVIIWLEKSRIVKDNSGQKTE
ncbi:MAG: hypothetical protein IJ532_05300 [Alphaproteobacteria bacterium]|nr:hypothetical protein [Alphaproteobacteria bacterium]